jgi:hypothetical protein
MLKKDLEKKLMQANLSIGILRKRCKSNNKQYSGQKQQIAILEKENFQLDAKIIKLNKINKEAYDDAYGAISYFKSCVLNIATKRDQYKKEAIKATKYLGLIQNVLNLKGGEDE